MRNVYDICTTSTYFSSLSLIIKKNVTRNKVIENFAVFASSKTKKKVPNNHHVQIVDTYSKNKTELTLKNDSLEFGMARFTHKQQLNFSLFYLLHLFEINPKVRRQQMVR